jgi:uncharacterized repeat protein (TIGR03803 family)
MRSANFPLSLLLVAASIFGIATRVGAQTERVLHSFDSSSNPQSVYYPSAGLVVDKAGNLYGATQAGGNGSSPLCNTDYLNACGVVYEVAPKAGGGWGEKVLHNFGNGQDGYFTQSGLILDAEGDLYGTTMYGGKNGCGIAFELMPQTGGSWREKVLYNFCSVANEADGQYPDSPLIFDASGNLYGETLYGGTTELAGTVFELSPKAGGWTEKVLYAFSGNGVAGGYGLTLDNAGNLYGVGSGGISNNGPCNFGCGLVFKLSPHSGGSWTYEVLYEFYSYPDDGYSPYSQLIIDQSGNLYGTTFYGGLNGGGTAFELSPSSGGVWTEKLLHSFAFNNVDGFLPEAGLVADSAGNLFGTTEAGGAYSNYGYGTAFELVPQTNGSWTESILHSFGNGTDGSNPVGGLFFDDLGNLYGATGGGGTSGGGTVFAIKP